MRQLIPLQQTNISGELIQTVNARELHAFLEVGKDFSNWIKDRIEQYNFLENQDFVFFAKTGENSGRGRPTIEYAISLDMAKELAMVERNEKGKQARRYFIDCEKRIKLGTLPNQPTPDLIQQTKTFRALYGVARLIGLDRNVSAVSANNAVYQTSGVNMLQLLGQTHLDNSEQTLYYTPTELGVQIDVSARAFNLMLAEAGLQSKIADKWVPSDAAAGLFRVLDTGKKHGDGTVVQQIKWSDKVLPKLKAIAA